MELGENLKEHFPKTTFYGLHAGNYQNSIWKPHSNFAFPEPYFRNNSDIINKVWILLQNTP